MHEAELHVQQHAKSFTDQARFKRIRFSVEAGGRRTITIEGQVTTFDDFHALKGEWENTNPPGITNIFVHVDPPR